MGTYPLSSDSLRSRPAPTAGRAVPRSSFKRPVWPNASARSLTSTTHRCRRTLSVSAAFPAGTKCPLSARSPIPKATFSARSPARSRRRRSIDRRLAAGPSSVPLYLTFATSRPATMSSTSITASAGSTRCRRSRHRARNANSCCSSTRTTQSCSCRSSGWTSFRVTRQARQPRRRSTV